MRINSSEERNEDATRCDPKGQSLDTSCHAMPFHEVMTHEYITMDAVPISIKPWTVSLIV